MLSHSKSYISEVVYSGLDVLRRACGGHGFSVYSGLPTLISEYAANLTHEGENTVLYLQTGRYLLKCYERVLRGKSNRGESVAYLGQADSLKKAVVDIGSEEELLQTQPSTGHYKHMQLPSTILKKAIIEVLSQVYARTSELKTSASKQDIIARETGSRLVEAVKLHAALFTYDSFQSAITEMSFPAGSSEGSSECKALQSLCLLYGIEAILGGAAYIASTIDLQPETFSHLHRGREALLAVLRPHVYGLTEGFNLPPELIRSALTQGDPYENYLELARKCQLNVAPLEAALTLREGLPKVIRAKL